MLMWIARFREGAERSSFSMATDNKSFVRSTTEEIWRTGDVRLIDAHMAPNYVLHKPPTGFSPDREGLKAILQAMHRAFPDLKMTVDDVVAEGDKVAQRRTYQGTHKGELFGIPATGQFVSVSQITVSRVADGKFVEEWAETDFLGMLQQLGVVPKMG
jgi:steroid delta-isomerase-like uncharacterized protein